MTEELDHAGNPVCGQDFMAGTICSDRPGHGGGHSAFCQTCGGDWANGTCTCRLVCASCGGYTDDDGTEDGTCYDCLEEPQGPTEEEMAQVYRSLGVAPPEAQDDSHVVEVGSHLRA